ncbi:MAG: ABC transporter ATP-binding protein [Gordonibacter sp.]|nr:ABC transporter ATP-binding protein [Gordonibacter sp.]
MNTQVLVGESTDEVANEEVAVSAIDSSEADILLNKVFAAPARAFGSRKQPRGHVALRARGVAFTYPQTNTSVFESIDLEIETGRVLAILGNNGAGKSTLLNLLAGITHPAAGSVEVGGRSLLMLSRREIAQHVAYVAQQQRIPHLSVYDQVLMGRRPHVSWTLSDHDRSVVAETIDRLGLEAFSTRFLDELSGGERQKVYIARALAQEPEILLLDEPTSALDPKNQIEVLETVRSITRAGSLATVLVIHDINLALRFCDRFLLMRDGQVISQGGCEAVTNKTLSAAYDIPFCIDEVAGVPVAVPL